MVIRVQNYHKPAGASPKTSIAQMNPKRTGVLLDFGMGTSFASFAELWDYLRHNGWATMPGKVRVCKWSGNVYV